MNRFPDNVTMEEALGRAKRQYGVTAPQLRRCIYVRQTQHSFLSGLKNGWYEVAHWGVWQDGNYLGYIRRCGSRNAFYFCTKGHWQHSEQFMGEESMDNIFTEIRAERVYQDQKWGNAFDDKNTANDWVAYIASYLGRAVTMPWDGAAYRKALLKVAALAVAAIQKYDEKSGEIAKRHYDAPEAAPQVSQLAKEEK